MLHITMDREEANLLCQALIERQRSIDRSSFGKNLSINNASHSK